MTFQDPTKNFMEIFHIIIILDEYDVTSNTSAAYVCLSPPH